MPILKPKIRIEHHLIGTEYDTTYFMMDTEQFNRLTRMKVKAETVFLASIRNDGPLKGQLIFHTGGYALFPNV